MAKTQKTKEPNVATVIDEIIKGDEETEVLRRQRLELGHFDSELDAAAAYDKAATQLFGQFTQLNFPKPATETDRLFPN